MAYSTNYAQLSQDVENLRLQVFELKRKLAEAEKSAVPPAPAAGSWMTVTVKFTNSPHWYRYLIMHVPGKGYYTTGTTADNGWFPTWARLWEYLNGPDVQSRSDLRLLGIERDSSVVALGK